MENQCNGCIFEGTIYGVDFIDLNKTDENVKVFCQAYLNGIPKTILEDKEKCIFKIDEVKK